MDRKNLEEMDDEIDCQYSIPSIAFRSPEDLLMLTHPYVAQVYGFPNILRPITSKLRRQVRKQETMNSRPALTMTDS